MKVQDLAKELGRRPKDFIRFLSEVDIKVKSGSTKLDDETVVLIRELFEEQTTGTKKKKEPEQPESRTISFTEDKIIVKDLATKLDVPLSEIMKELLQKGLLVNLNSELELPMAIELARIFELTVEEDESKETVNSGDAKIKQHLDTIEDAEVEGNLDDLIDRPPVITIMGHVDHGKTLLLDTIRKTNVVDKEAGGITQHIGAYQVTINEKKLTFLDTPGHEAFTTLRARGAQITDIAILVVAADEGVKPQTIEAINHAKAANVPIIVAINKMDKPEANVDRVKQMLSEYDLVAEDWGGKIIMVPVSAKSGKGIDELLEMIQLVSDMGEIKANPNVPAKGIVIESRLSRQKGPVATVLIKSGTLRIGDNFVVGNVSGKVRALLNERNEKLEDAEPGSPIEILGISEVPRPGDMLEVHDSEKETRSIAANRTTQDKQSTSGTQQVSLENLSKQIEKGELGKLNLIVKADFNGSLEAVIASIQQIPNEEVSIRILHSSTGPITENDVMLARASNAIIIGFSVPVSNTAESIAAEVGIEIKTYAIIYEIIDDIKRVLEGMFEIQYEEVEIGKAEVRTLFKFSKVGVIAGSYVISGKVFRNAIAKVYRGDELVFKGKITSLKRFKEDAKEVLHGYECGIVTDGFTQYKEGDVVLIYEVKEKKRR